MKFKRADDYYAFSLCAAHERGGGSKDCPRCGLYTIVPYESPRDGGCFIAWRAQEGRTAARLLGWPRWQAGDSAGREQAYRAAVGLCEQDAARRAAA